jgi:hypothetical protein
LQASVLKSYLSPADWHTRRSTPRGLSGAVDRVTTALALANSRLPHNTFWSLICTRHDKGSLAQRTDRGEGVGRSMFLLVRSK